AVQGIKKIYEGARAYFMEESVGKGASTPIPKQFPIAAVAPTPAETECCNQAGDKCQADPTLWATGIWNELKFSMDDPHYYSYYYRGAGLEGLAQFTAGANGDLDCDSTYATYEMVGSISSVDNSVTGSAGIFKENEIE